MLWRLLWFYLEYMGGKWGRSGAGVTFLLRRFSPAAHRLSPMTPLLWCNPSPFMRSAGALMRYEGVSAGSLILRRWKHPPLSTRFTNTTFLLCPRFRLIKVYGSSWFQCRAVYKASQPSRDQYWIFTTLNRVKGSLILHNPSSPPAYPSSCLSAFF